MNYLVWTYLFYLSISVALTMWVARTLSKNGRVFLVESFHGNENIADSVNHLLVVGFYLINVGYVTLALKYGDKPGDMAQAIEFLSTKVGLVLLVLGFMHFFNLAVFSRLRSGRPAPAAGSTTGFHRLEQTSMTMLPTLEGIIRRRVLLNFRAEPEVCRPLVPPPFEILIQNGFAIVGVCLIRLEQLRPKGLPSWTGLQSENMAHRIAVRYPTSEGNCPGVFIWRRDTNQPLTALFGGRLFPGVHDRAEFRIADGGDSVAMEVSTPRNVADVRFKARPASHWEPTLSFSAFAELSNFIQAGSCGFSCARRDGEMEGMQLRTLQWKLQPLDVTECRAEFYENGRQFPRGSVEFDHGLLMRGIPHEWDEIPGISSVPLTLTGGAR